MSKDINKMVIDLLERSEKTLFKIYVSLNPTEPKPDLETLKKFRKSMIHAIKRNKDEALKLFPIIQYLNTKLLDDEDVVYDDSLFSVGLDERIAMASPIQVLDEVPQDSEYDFKFRWDFTDIEERESAIFDAVWNYYSMIKNDQNIRDFLTKIGLFTEEYLTLVLREAEFFRDNVPQEVFALHQTDDLNYLLPIELAQLDDPELEILFYKSFIEKKLLSYQLWGIEREIAEEWEIFRKKKDDMGELIICLDTSGSMRGINEVLSKGLALALVDVLESLNIPVVFMTFSMRQNILDLRQGYDRKGDKTRAVAKMLRSSFYGGTDFDGMIENVATKLLTNKLKRSNVLVISDFTFKNLSEQSKAAIEAVSEQKEVSFHALQISDNPIKNKIMDAFKSSWSYSFVWLGVQHSEEEMINELSHLTNFNDLSQIHAFGVLKMLTGKSKLDLRGQPGVEEKVETTEKISGISKTAEIDKNAVVI